jgi:hypothetical protein
MPFVCCIAERWGLAGEPTLDDWLQTERENNAMIADRNFAHEWNDAIDSR